MKIVQITTVLALTILALTGCAAFPNSSSGYDAGVFPYSSVEGQVDDLGSPEGISSRPESAVITTAYAFLTDEDPSRVADDIQTLTTSAGGKIDGRSVQSDPDGRTNYVSLTVRIPYGATDAFLADLDGVATVQSLNQNSQDVTLIVTDYEARISALETSIARFLALGKDARSTQDLSTVQVDIGLPDSATDPIPDDFWGGIVAGWKGLIAFFTGTLVAIGFAIPWIPVIAGLGWLGMWLVRRFVTRRSATSAPAKKSAKH
jgi:hypothetical protein